MAIKNNSFKYLTNVKWLDLSYNRIYKMEGKAFLGLTKLSVLLLNGNRISPENESYANGVFDSLATQLKILDIRRNLQDVPQEKRIYPAKALSKLSMLETLALDCISGKALDEEFGNLSNLRKLNFADGVQTEHVASDMFKAVSNLKIEVVNFTNVNIGIIEGKVFSVLSHLKVLHLTNNPRLTNQTVDISLALKQTAIEELNLSYTCLGITESIDPIMVNLRDTNIKNIFLDSNEIHIMGRVFSHIPSIEVFSFNYNNFGDYYLFFGDLYLAKNLRSMYFSYQNTDFMRSFCGNQSRSMKPHRRISEHKNYSLTSCGFRPVCKAYFPPKLEWWGFSHNGFHHEEVPEIKFMNNGSLRHLDMSYNIFRTLPNPFTCNKHVISTIEYFNISNSEIKCMSRHMFSYCSWSIKYANLSHNIFGKLEGNCNKDPSPRDIPIMIKPLTSLISLDFSSNFLNKLYNDSFEMQKQLRELRISHNELSTWEPIMDHLIHLELLDLSFNRLKCLSERTRLELDQLENHPEYRKTDHISIDLEGNPLGCSCRDIQYLKWLKTTGVRKVNIERYQCTERDGRKISFSDGLDAIISNLESECTDNIWLIWIGVWLFVYFVTVTITTCWYRYRHYFQYLIIKMRMRRECLEALIGQNDYEYDAFISCTREGAKWCIKYLIPKLENNKTGLKFCIAQRDFLVGKTIIDNIMDSINKSHKTILLIDQTFIHSKWCNEELLLSHHVSNILNFFNPALNESLLKIQISFSTTLLKFNHFILYFQESLSRGYNMIICIFMPEIDVSERHLPARINMLRHQVTCIKWPCDEVAHQVFWIQMERALLQNKERPIVNA